MRLSFLNKITEGAIPMDIQNPSLILRPGSNQKSTAETPIFGHPETLREPLPGEEQCP